MICSISVFAFGGTIRVGVFRFIAFIAEVLFFLDAVFWRDALRVLELSVLDESERPIAGVSLLSGFTVSKHIS
jgi:hypothetical protein